MTLAFSPSIPVIARSAPLNLRRPGDLSRPAKRLRSSRRNAPVCSANPLAAAATSPAALSPAGIDALSKTGDPSPYAHTDATEGGGPIPKLILDARTAFYRVMALAWPLERNSILRALVFSLLTSVSVLIAPMFFSKTLNSIVSGGSDLLHHAFCLSVVYFVSAVCKYFAIRCTSAATFEIGASLRTTLFDRLIRAGMSSLHLAGGVGSALSSLQADADVVEVAASEKLTTVVTGFFEAIIAFVCLVFLCPQMALIASFVGPYALFIAARFGARAAVVARNRAFAQAVASHAASEYLGAMSTVKAFTAEPAAETKYGSGILDALSWGLNASRARSAMEAWNRCLFTGATVAILAIGGLLVSGGHLSVGAMLAFAAYTSLLSSSLEKSNKALCALVRAAGPAERLQLVMSLPSEDVVPSVNGSRKPVTVGPASVEFRDVSFLYPGSTRLALNHVSFKIPAGISAAFVGRSGAGRTTIANLIARFYVAGSGKVLIGGVDVGQMTPALLRSELLGIVSQDAHMLPGTIADNIALGRKGAQPDEIRMAARNAGVFEFTRVLKRGLDESAEGLSVGQRQRINMARVLLRETSVVIADEPVAALDPISETFVNDCLDQMIRDEGTTVLLSSHNVARARVCDKIFVVDEGRIIEEGTHDELVARGGLYFELLSASNGHRRVRRPTPPPVSVQHMQVPAVEASVE